MLIGIVLATAPAHAETVTSMFSKAQKALKEGKTKSAYKSLLGIIRKYPDHEPSHLLLGHILARAGENGKAYKHFKRISPDLVTPDLGYEYGLIMFQAKNCGKALQGFGRVPSGSKYADVASFYRGICYYRSRQFQKAQYYLSKAKNLPASLQAARRQGLSETRQQARRERQGGSYQANPYLIVPTPPPMPLAYDPYASAPPPGAPAPGTEAAPAAPPKKPEKPPPPPTGTTTAVTPSLTITQKTTTQDFFGFKQSQTQSDKQELKAAFVMKYTGEPRASGGQPFVSLPVDLSQSRETTKGDIVAYKAYSDDPSTIIEEQTPIPGVTTTITGVKLQPTGDYPISGSSDVSVAYLADIKTIKTSVNSREAKNSELGPVGNATIGDDSLNLKLTLSHTVVSDEKIVDDGELKGVDQNVKTDKDKIVADVNKNWDSVSGGVTVTNQSSKTVVSGSSAGISYPPSIFIVSADMTKTWETFSLTSTVTQQTKADQKIEGFTPIGEVSSLKVDVSGTKTLSFGGNITVTATMNQLTGYRRTFADPTAPPPAEGSTDPVAQIPVSASGSEQTVFASFKLTPIDWLFGIASYKTTTRTFDGVDPKILAQFQTAEPETVTELIFQIGVTKTF